jgi:hypothetical protein
MAWRIEHIVVRGEIDNRERNRVTGTIWLVGRDEPVVFELKGNAWQDLAGRRLEFVNPDPRPGEPCDLAACQAGVIGDCTASRRVKVPEVSVAEMMELCEQRKPFPWHWGNSLYFEWFSTANGRVVIESADYHLTIGPEIAWEMTAAEEKLQRGANAQAMDGFMRRMGDTIPLENDDNGRQTREDNPAEWEAKPFTEEEAEKMQEESDRLADRIHARMEQEGEGADYELILEQELERRQIERGEPPPRAEDEARRTEWLEEMNRIVEQATTNPDPELEAELARKHPLAEQAFELSVRLRKEPATRGWLRDDFGEEHPLIDLSFSAMKAGAKFAGALNGGTWPPEVLFCGSKIVRLKRARGYLDDALLALEVCLQERLADLKWLEDVRRELNALAHDCDLLIAELRTLLERGFD